MRKLTTIAKDIQGALKTSTQGRIKIGKLLNEARTILKSDKLFGEWRSDNLSAQLDQKTANRYMRLAECFSNNLPDNIPLSGLYELSKKLNDTYRDAALEFLADEDDVSLKDVGNAISRAKAILEKTSVLDEVLSKINDLSERDSWEVLKKIVKQVGITKVQDWLEMDILDKEAA